MFGVFLFLLERRKRSIFTRNKTYTIMSTTTVKKELITYLPLLSASQQTLVLDMVKSILHIDTKEKRISIEQYNKEIELAVKEIREGKTTSHEEVVNNSKKWLKRK